MVPKKTSLRLGSECRKFLGTQSWEKKKQNWAEEQGRLWSVPTEASASSLRNTETGMASQCFPELGQGSGQWCAHSDPRKEDSGHGHGGFRQWSHFQKGLPGAGKWVSAWGGCELCRTAPPTDGSNVAHQAVFKFLVTQGYPSPSMYSFLFYRTLSENPIILLQTNYLFLQPSGSNANNCWLNKNQIETFTKTRENCVQHLSIQNQVFPSERAKHKPYSILELKICTEEWWERLC